MIIHFKSDSAVINLLHQSWWRPITVPAGTALPNGEPSPVERYAIEFAGMSPVTVVFESESMRDAELKALNIHVNKRYEGFWTLSP